MPAYEIRKNRSPERTRESLVDAAAKLFLQQGLERPSLDAICELAGYTRGAFYVHFKTREELVAAVVERALSEFLDAMVSRDASDLFGIIEVFGNAMRAGLLPVSHRMRSSQALEACAKSEALRGKLIALLAEARGRIAAAARRGLASGALRSEVNPDAIADVLLCTALGVLTLAQLGVSSDTHATQRMLRQLLSHAAPEPRGA